MSNTFTFVYFGGEPIGAPVLAALLQTGMTPALVVTNPDRPVGRKQTLTPPPVKVLAAKHEIPVFQPEHCRDRELLAPILNTSAEVYVVVAYNHILPSWLINTPRFGAVNVHPSLLPDYRGPNPIRQTIIDDARRTGVSVMLLDSKMDHGPLLAQQPLEIAETEWPLAGPVLDEKLAELGGALLTKTLPEYLQGHIVPQEQDHAKATYTKKLTRADGELKLNPLHLPTGPVAREAYLKIKAYEGWPETFFMQSGKRVKIKEAKLAENGSLRLLRVIPEGKSEMEFDQYLATFSA